ncbi:MAG: fibronectin type III domain-containing protein, partial [Deltaproteobacteria bacterium]|nr:fibronectin type III domain-containing protein [Deltaproteobacteria bacterium]
AGGYAASTGYEMKIVLKSDGARYYVKGGAYADWTLIKDNSNYSDAVMRIAFTQNSQQANIHEVKVREALTDTGASLGTEETSACYAFTNTWEQGYSNQSEATTSSPVAPSGLVVTAITDTRFDLSWTDNTDAESGFRIERCSGSGCSNFAQIDTVGTDETSYTDTTAPPSTESSYRVRAFKNSSCPWNSGYSNISSDLSFPAASTSLIATALNSRMIKLDWDDNASDEDGYEVEVQAWNGLFTKIADLPADSVSYVDTMSIQPETEYRYRIRPYRSLDIAPYSNEAVVTTPAYVAGDGTCPP